MGELSVFTPTYNRKNLLSRLYHSLLSQTDKGFEWIIVDDGSTDGTKECVELWIAENNIKITYVFQENAGKHVAINVASDICKQKWMCVVDSDDYLTSDAIEYINSLLSVDKENDAIIGFVGPRGDLCGNIIYQGWPNDQYTKIEDLYDRYHFAGETIVIIRTDVIRENKFPVYKGEKFMPENVLYRRINNLGVFRYFSKVIYCFEYMSDGYTKNSLKNIINSPRGCALSRNLEATGKGSLIYRAKNKAFSNAISCIMKQERDVEELGNSGLLISLASILIEPYYVAKLLYGINKYSK